MTAEWVLQKLSLPTFSMSESKSFLRRKSSLPTADVSSSGPKRRWRVRRTDWILFLLLFESSSSLCQAQSPPPISICVKQVLNLICTGRTTLSTLPSLSTDNGRCYVTTIQLHTWCGSCYWFATLLCVCVLGRWWWSLDGRWARRSGRWRVKRREREERVRSERTPCSTPRGVWLPAVAKERCLSVAFGGSHPSDVCCGALLFVGDWFLLRCAVVKSPHFIVALPQLFFLGIICCCCCCWWIGRDGWVRRYAAVGRSVRIDVIISGRYAQTATSSAVAGPGAGDIFAPLDPNIRWQFWYLRFECTALVAHQFPIGTCRLFVCPSSVWADWSGRP
jgi:hypothetical protein